MFTGIIATVGRIEASERRGTGARIEVGSAASLLRRLKRGDSIAVNGCCLTIVSQRNGRCTADLTRETLDKTTLGSCKRGDRVNLEAPLRASDLLSGHLLQGHVEATGSVKTIEPAGDGGYRLDFAVPAEIERYLAPKGSIAVDGISLTVAALSPGTVGVAIIPHTWKATNLRFLKPGDAVNLETDAMARHLERLLEARAASPARRTRDLTVAQLRSQGF